ncbi:hypothetical protein [Mycolicibacterium pallens]|uniref:Intersectin-EH binding protein Ibp1 n=1 Tax=Mycolicibacterium pallens TaxID=370524 RepID=A0ABX8VFU9_9MYCO|nr:hypothetical protein [Mycolicibacterium pallens]APE14645.1 hypothetical protein BOH72_04865 [Mycobacterium sp. WY10]QYL14851.1 hypothetical protein K0O64_16885 [Mycolicibacterium pallens]
MEFAISSALARRLAYGVAGLIIATAPAVAAFTGAFDGAPRVLACSETDTEDSFSMNCAPTVIPDTSDMLTEAEVAEPGWNGGNHSGGGGGGGGGHR